jgi:hypothetical protein
MSQPAAIAQVVDRLQCELYEAILDLDFLKDENGFSWVRNYVAKAVLTLQVNTDAGIAPEISFLGPFGNGTYSLGVGGGVAGAANRIAAYGFVIDFSRAKPDWCPNGGTNGYPPLTGEFGIREWLSAVLLSHNANDPFPRPKSLSHRLDFTMDGNLRITPAFTLTRSKGSTLFGVHRKDFHTLEIDMEYLSAKDRNPIPYSEVCVVNMPGPCYIPVPGQPKTSTSPELAPLGAPRVPAVPSVVARPRVVAPRVQSKAPPELPADVQQRLDRALQNLELRSLGPRL